MEIPGYIIERVIAEGGMSTVYLATQQSLNRKVALKVLSKQLFFDESFQKRFLKEGQIVAQLDHPKIVTIFDIGAHDKYYYISQEYLPGGSVANEIETGLTIPRALFVVKCIADALGYAHARGFIHRDIKPQNILFRDDKYRSAILTDFGIAKATASDISTTLTVVGSFCGSPAYASPEQARGLKLDGRSDIYSLGVVLFQMLTGQVPYSADEPLSLAVRHLTDPVPRLPDHLRGRFQPVIDRCLAKDPDGRFASAEELIRAVKAAEDAPQTAAVFSEAEENDSVEDVDATLVLPRKDFERDLSATRQSRESAQAARAGISVAGLTRPAGHRSASMLGYIVLGVCLLSAAFWYASQKWNSVEVVAEAGTGVQKPGEKARAEDTDGWLATANEHLRAGRLFAPDGDSAYDAYRKVLRADEGNAQASAGIEALLRRQFESIEARLAAGDWVVAETLAGQLRRVEPVSDEYLLAVQAIEKQKYEQEKQDKIQALLAAAQDHEAAGRLFRPDNENAFSTLHAALAGGADRTAIKDRVGGLLERQRVLVRGALEKQDFAAGLDLIEVVLRAKPGDRDFVALRDEVRERQAAAARRAATAEQHAEWLRQAQRFVLAGKLVDPGQDNAYTLFRRVLDADPGNKTAQAGITSLTDKIAAQARQAAVVDDIDRGLTLVASGLRIDRDHRGLLELRVEMERRRKVLQDIQTLLAEAQRHREALRLVEPAGRNALETYRRVLQIDPGNLPARQGIAQLVRDEELLAVRSFETGLFQASLKRIAAGLSIDTSDASLLALRQRVEQAIQDERRERRAALQQARDERAAQQAAKVRRAEGDAARQAREAVVARDREPPVGESVTLQGEMRTPVANPPPEAEVTAAETGDGPPGRSGEAVPDAVPAAPKPKRPRNRVYSTF